MIRSMEAVISSALLLGTIIYLFNVPATLSKDPMEQYVKGLTDSYSKTIQNLVTKDPASIELLMDKSMPNGYAQRTRFNYYRKYSVFTGLDGAPVEVYTLLPSEGSLSLENSEIKSNWYRSVFKITNTGSESINGQTSISASLYKQDVDNNGLTDPIDRDSIRVFSDEGELNSTITKYEDYYDRAIVGISVDISLGPGEVENIYVYYLLGDDYE